MQMLQGIERAHGRATWVRHRLVGTANHKTMFWFTGTGRQMQIPGTAKNCTKGNSGEAGGTLARWVGALFTKGEETGGGKWAHKRG